jgi:hypothetical protein
MPGGARSSAGCGAAVQAHAWRVGIVRIPQHLLRLLYRRRHAAYVGSSVLDCLAVLTRQHTHQRNLTLHSLRRSLRTRSRPVAAQTRVAALYRRLPPSLQRCWRTLQ